MDLIMSKRSDKEKMLSKTLFLKKGGLA